MIKRIFLCLLALLLAVPAFAENADPQAEIAALNARIAELEATVADLQARLAVYEPAEIDPEAEIITFNGGSVKQAVAQAAYDELAVLYDEFGMNKGDYHDMVVEDVLTNLAEDAVLTNKAIALNVYENTPEQIAAAENEARSSYEATVNYYMPYFQSETLSEEEVRAETEAYLAGEGLTYEQVLEELLSGLWRDRLYQATTADITVSEADVRALYDSSLADDKAQYADLMMYEYDYCAGEIILHHPEGYREVEYLLLPYSEEEFAEEDLALRADMLTSRSSDLIDRATNGEDLIVLAEDSMLYDYGTAVVCGEAAMMTQTFCDAAMALTLNETVAMPDEDGVWIIRYTGDITPGDVPYEDVQDLLTEAAAENAKLDAYYALVEQWLAEAEIVTHPEMLR